MHIAIYISRPAFKDEKKKKKIRKEERERKKKTREEKKKKRILLRAASYTSTRTRLIVPGEKRILFRWFRTVATEIHR